MTEVAEIQFTHSESIGAFMPAFVKAKDSMGAVVKDATNPHLKNQYATLGAVLDVVEPALASQDITMLQLPFSTSDRVGVVTRLWHKSGEWMQAVLGLKPVKADPQAEGSAITYARRYSAMTICGIVPEDDDGNAASGRGDRREEPPRQAQERRQDGQRQARTSSSQAKKDGTWEHLAGALALCRSKAEVDEWGRKHAAEIKALPRKWYDALAEERAKHLETLKPRGPEPLSTPDSDFPPDWEKWQNDLASQITQAKSAEAIDDLLEVNADGLEGCEEVFEGSAANIREHAAAVKQRLRDHAERGR